ncbi:MAG: PAS domain S-box protein [Spirochaetes bacterium]|nr:PAS domain S-box protein [Spirochaetota bacterium]
MDRFHEDLRKIIARHYRDPASIPEDVRSLLDAINRDYHASRPAPAGIAKQDKRDPAPEAVISLIRDNDTLRMIMSAFHDLLFLLGPEDSIVDFFASPGDLYLDPVTFLGRRIEDLPFGPLAAQFADTIRAVRQKGESARIGYSLLMQGVDEPFIAQFLPCRDHVIAVIRHAGGEVSPCSTGEAYAAAYRDFFETLGIGYFEVDLKGHFTAMNDALCGMIRYERAEIIGRSFRDFTDAETAGRIFREYNAMFRKGDVLRLTLFSMTRRDGSLCFLEGSTAVMVRDDGEKTGFFGLLRDVTERITQEEALRKSEEKYRMLADNSADVIWTMDMNLNYTYISPAGAHLLGYTPEEQVAMGVAGILTPESLSTAMQFYRDEISLLKNGIDTDPSRIRILELQMNHRNGSIVETEVTLHFIHDLEQRPVSIVGITRDVTERKRTGEALRRSEEELRRRNKKIEEELKTAQHIQRALVTPVPPVYRDLAIAYRYLPLAAIGGDYFSFTPLTEGGLGVFISDVSNHGVPAALFLSLVRAMSEKVCRNDALAPARFLRNLNAELLGNMPMSFVTAIYGVFAHDEARTRLVFSFSCAGHPRPLLHRRADGTIIELNARGTLIGPFRDISNDESRVELEPGDRIYLFTDGFPETEDAQGRIIGYDHLSSFILHNSKPALDDTLDGIIAALERYRGSAEQLDDILIMGFEFRREE